HTADAGDGLAARAGCLDGAGIAEVVDGCTKDGDVTAAICSDRAGIREVADGYSRDGESVDCLNQAGIGGDIQGGRDDAFESTVDSLGIAHRDGIAPNRYAIYAHRRDRAGIRGDVDGPAVVRHRDAVRADRGDRAGIADDI